MSNYYSHEPMLEMFVFETSQLVEQLEKSIIFSEKEKGYKEADINEIFRIMHTIKGSAAMMLFNEISLLAHSIEDLFFLLREKKVEDIDYSRLSDLVLDGVDFIKVEIEKIKSGDEVDGTATPLINEIQEFLISLKEKNTVLKAMNHKKENITKQQQYYIPQEKRSIGDNLSTYKAIIHFDDGCQMENIRAYTIVHNLQEITKDFYYLPEDIMDDDASLEVIRQKGFIIYMKTDRTYEELQQFFLQTAFLKDLQLDAIENKEDFTLYQKESHHLVYDDAVKIPDKEEPKNHQQEDQGTVTTFTTTSTQQSIISVSVNKLDKLMDLVGEMVIAEAMVTQNPDLKGLNLDNFYKAARQLHKITSELQDMVMSIRMVSLSTTFHKMHRVVRDMCKKLKKEVRLEIVGEETEVDKNIIEYISDPLMHLVRNAVDHGIESPQDREKAGKPPTGTIILEAKNSGSDVLVIVKDNGKGLSKEKILKKAKDNGLIDNYEEEMLDKEIFNLILVPGFSTKEGITEFSGRGVGMDVVKKNIETVGGTVSVDSVEGQGTTMTLKIPLTLAIIDGMNLRVGNSRYTLSTITIKESFRPKEEDIIRNPDGREMIMVRGQCYPILRLHEVYNVKNSITKLTEGILIMVEQDDQSICIYADELLGQQQVVVKTLPSYIKSRKKIEGLAGCTLLGDGSISLILDTAGLIQLASQ